MPRLGPLANPENWRIDDSGHMLVHRVKLKEGSSVYTLYEIRRVTWATSVKGCLAALTRWLREREPSTGPPEKVTADVATRRGLKLQPERRAANTGTRDSA